MRITIATTWDGAPIGPDERVTLGLTAAGGGLVVEVEAPLHGDPPPPGPPGATPGLWEYEVVELFVYGEAGRYLEVELGPHGHHLALALAGVRRVTRDRLAIGYACAAAGGRWRGRAEIPAAWIPAGAARWNAHAIHGVGAGRRWLSAVPAGGARPDFHRPEATAPLTAEIVAGLDAGSRGGRA